MLAQTVIITFFSLRLATPLGLVHYIELSQDELSVSEVYPISSKTGFSTFWRLGNGIESEFVFIWFGAWMLIEGRLIFRFWFLEILLLTFGLML